MSNYSWLEGLHGRIIAAGLASASRQRQRQSKSSMWACALGQAGVGGQAVKVGCKMKLRQAGERHCGVRTVLPSSLTGFRVHGFEALWECRTGRQRLS